MRTIRSPFFGLIAIVVLGTAGYVFIEGWTPFEALWMVAITLTTIGFGEVHPLSPQGRAFTLLLIASGVGVVTQSLAMFTSYVANGDLARDVEFRRRRRIMTAMRDHVIVVGHGRLGREITAELAHSKQPFVVVDLEDDHTVGGDGVMLVGDGSSDEVLEQAGIARARGLAVVTASDAVNVYVTLSARHLNPKLFIVTRIEEESARAKAERAGASEVISPFFFGGVRAAHALVRPGSTHFFDHALLRRHQDLALDDVVVQDGSDLCGSLRNLGLRSRFGVLVVAIDRPGKGLTYAPDPDKDLVCAGDTLVVVGTPDKVREFRRLNMAAPL